MFMLISSSSHTIKYRILPETEGVCLSIWEPAPRTSNRDKPYRFSLNYKLASETEAKEMLNRYLNAYGAMALKHTDIPPKRHLKVLPNPTHDFWC